MDTVHIDLGENSYDVMLDEGLIERAGREIITLTGAGKAVILTETAVEKLYGQDLKRRLEEEGAEVLMMNLSPGENIRNLSVVKRVYEALAEFGIGEKDVLIALGGRAVGDITGFAAATFQSGIPYVQVPTSLLAQIGSSIGGKVSVDLGNRKNIIGVFYQPRAVYIDTAAVRTLPPRYIHNGFGEAIKVGCVADKELFEIFEEASSDKEIIKRLPELIRRCVEIKAPVIEMDPRGKGERRILDFGHLIGRAAERYYRFNDQKITHGEATAAGMYMITKASEMFGLTKQGTAQRIAYVLKSVGLPAGLDIPPDALSSLIEENDRFGKGNEIPLILEIGKGYLYSGNTDMLKKYLYMK